MRRVGYGLLLLLLVLALLPLASFAWRRWEAWRNLAPARNSGLDERVLFEPIGERGLQFNASTHQGWFALQGFVIAPPAVRSRGLPVTIEVGLHQPGGVIRERRYLALPPASQVAPYGLLDGRAEQAAWVLPTEWIDLTGRDGVRAVSVRVLDAGPGTLAVLWRGAIDQRLSDPATQLRYRRLGDRAREALTADWVTPPALVHPAIKQELLRYRQQRIGPMGQPGRDFAARQVLRQLPANRPRHYDARPLAIAISPAMHVAVDIEAGQEVVVDARRGDGSPLAISISGPVAGGLRAEGRWRGAWAPGRYLLRSSHAGSVDVRDAASGDSLLPAGLRPRTHRVTAARSLHYPLYPLDAGPPPVRLRLRAEQADAEAVATFLDAGGRLLASQRIDVPLRASVYDRPVAALDRAAAEAVQVELQPPADARRLRIAASAPVLAHALTTLPEAGPDGRRWFSFQPELDPRSALAQGVVIVEQPRPGGDRPRRGDAAPAGRPMARGAGIARAGAEPGVRIAKARTVAPAPRPRLRLRPARSEPGEDGDAD